MKKTRLLNSEISYEISKLGHTDFIVICDAGLPIPENVKRIDMALEKGNPRFMDTLDVISDEMQIEKAIIAAEMRVKSPELYKELSEWIKNKYGNIEIVEIEHEEFKKITHGSKAVIRTGEFIPYANIILQSGVVF